MRGLHKIALLAAGILVVSGLALAGGDAWFDMENCGFCKSLLEDPELLHHMTWEQYSISNGIISVTTVEKDYMDSFKKAHTKMAGVAEQLQQGNQIPMCNSCMAIGQIMMKGPHSEQVATNSGEIWLMTSEDPAVVEEMQQWAKKNMAELAKMEKTEG
jgi:hypothetical protein